MVKTGFKKWLQQAEPINSSMGIESIEDMLWDCWGAARESRDAEVQSLVDALRGIAKGDGPFSRDPLTRASNCIDSMKNVAKAALL